SRRKNTSSPSLHVSSSCSWHTDTQHLPSFPTRRSSDLSFSIATIQTQLLSPRSRPQLVLSSKLVPSQCADTSVTGKGNFLETMMPRPARLADSWRQARGRRLVRIAIQRSGDAISFSSLQPEIEVRRATRAADTGCYARHGIPGIVP